jgi:hypothetical protein
MAGQSQYLIAMPRAKAPSYTKFGQDPQHLPRLLGLQSCSPLWEGR